MAFGESPDSFSGPDRPLEQAGHWSISPGAEFTILGEVAHVVGAESGSGIATQNAWTTGASTQGFTVATTAALDASTDPAFAGLILLRQDDQNFYALRFNGVGRVQFVRVTDGEPSALVNTDQVLQYTRGNPLRLRVSSPMPFLFDATISDAVTGQVLWQQNGIRDPASTFSEGSMGIIVSPRVRATFDDFVFVESAEYDDKPSLAAPPVSERTWVNIPSGTFRMGAQPGPGVMDFGVEARKYGGPQWDEAPVHDVTIQNAFEMHSHLVKCGEFEEFKAGHRAFMAGRGLAWSAEAPVTMVTWQEANDYAEWLSRKTGETLRLPTEAEWEHAARQWDRVPLTQMDGSVREWCLDWWAPYPDAPRTDPTGPTKGMARVTRGGVALRAGEKASFVEAEMPETGGRVTVADARRWRPSDRSATLPGDRRDNVGFRLVRAQPPNGSPTPEVEPDLVFRNVASSKKQWQPTSPENAILEGGKPFIDAPASPEKIPYWGRHHVPSLAHCDNGDILLTCFTSPDDSSDQMAVLITRLRDGQTGWDPPARFFITPDFNLAALKLWRDAGGVIHSYNVFGNMERHDYSTAKMTSSDNGATWTQPKIVFEYPGKRADLRDYTGEPNFFPHIPFITLRDGTLIAPVDAGWPSAHGRNFGTALFASTDNGDSWQERTRWGWGWQQYAKPDGQAGWIAGYHTPVVELKNGDLLAIPGRTDNIDGRSPLSRSSDGGKTWTYGASPFPPLMWHQRPAIIRLAEGPILLVSFTDSSDDLRAGKREGIDVSDAAGNTRRGYGMFAALSFDEGESWTSKKIIPTDPADPWGHSDQTGYISIIQTPDNMIHLANSQRYFRFNLAWLRDPMPVP